MIKKIFKLRLLYIILLIIFWQINVNAAEYKTTNIEYGIIKGVRVNLRLKPGIKSEIIRQTRRNELAFYLEKTDNKYKVGGVEDYWYKIKTQGNKACWVFGKYFHHFKVNNRIDKFYIQFINKCLISSGCMIYEKNNITTVFNVTHEQQIGDRYITFKCCTFSEDPTGNDASLVIYEILDNDEVREVIDSLIGSKYYLIDQYIIMCDRFAVQIYDSNKYYKEDWLQKGYRCVDSVFLSHFEGRNSHRANRIEFDPKTQIVSVRLKKSDSAPMELIKFKFIKGKFVKIESEVELLETASEAPGIRQK